MPLVVNLQGERLAKRDGPVTPTSLGLSAEQVLTLLGSSLGLCAADEPVSIGVLLDRFDRNTLRHEPWAFDPTALAGGME